MTIIIIHTFVASVIFYSTNNFKMAMLGFPLYVSIILCLTVEIYSDLAIISAIAELKDRMDDLDEKTSATEKQLNKSIDSINLKMDRLGHFSNADTEEGDVVETNERVIKALISEKGFVRKSLSVYGERLKDFQKIMVEQMTVLNSTIEASHDNLERKLAENVAKLNASWNKLRENYQTDCKYVVRIQVADSRFAGTANDINVRIYGHEEHTATFRMHGDFYRNVLVEDEFREFDVRPIQRVVVSADMGGVKHSLLIVYVSIFIEDSDDYYVFTYRDNPYEKLTEGNSMELSISQHPERCIHTYGEAINRKPNSGNLGSSIGVMSLRECKQRCATTRSISCNSIYVKPEMGDGRLYHCYHNTHSPDFSDNTIYETSDQYVSYQRICREP